MQRSYLELKQDTVRTLTISATHLCYALVRTALGSPCSLLHYTCLQKHCTPGRLGIIGIRGHSSIHI